MKRDVIAAISTPRGEGGIAIVRISGGGALDVAKQVFRRRRRAVRVEPWRVYLGEVIGEGDEPLDECLFTYFRAPRSFTGEDVVEFSIHGGSFVAGRVLEVLVARGARVAEPGEFTQRAFVNGRLSLAQAEAVIDIIRAASDVALQNAGRQLRGVLSSEVRQMRAHLLKCMAHLEAQLDFPEHDIPAVTRAEVASELTRVENMLLGLLATVRAGRVAREGLRVVLAGRPNVGKSSLLNALAGQERAIVTAQPGTTRDTVEVELNLNGVLVTLVDTAGLRESEDEVEQLGIERTLQALETADVVLVLLDSSEPLRRDDLALLDLTKERERLVVLTKSDLASRAELPVQSPALAVSTRTRSGLAELIGQISAVAVRAVSSESSLLVTNLRHSRILAETKSLVTAALETVALGWDIELVATDVRLAYERLGEITGETITPDIADAIFAEFCIGK
ncbi:MAG: tRNA uridine-5-carboxymethylaminomethyl(34) synthesis GTPase MnmE [Selenomonadales bacterium]|nr:tRNA uridine-5-carboxymethylaminomethyl(34) synthesis GTPase MnmE [Selenomonadales bacterium]